MQEWKVYILFSEARGQYYIGSTGDFLDQRIRRHNTNHKGFTGSVNDWSLKYSEACSTKAEALKREKEIKGWKSKKMIEKLISDSIL